MMYFRAMFSPISLQQTVCSWNKQSGHPKLDSICRSGHIRGSECCTLETDVGDQTQARATQTSLLWQAAATWQTAVRLKMLRNHSGMAVAGDKECRGSGFGLDVWRERFRHGCCWDPSHGLSAFHGAVAQQMHSISRMLTVFHFNVNFKKMPPKHRLHGWTDGWMCYVCLWSNNDVWARKRVPVQLWTTFLWLQKDFDFDFEGFEWTHDIGYPWFLFTYTISDQTWWKAQLSDVECVCVCVQKKTPMLACGCNAGT